MPEIVLTPRPALGHAPLGRPGGPLRLEVLPEGRLIHVLASPSADADTLVARLGPSSSGGSHAIRPYAPGQWFVVGEQPLAPGELHSLATSFGEAAALSDQSHGRVRLALAGAAATRVLAKGCALDLADAAFPIRRSASCLFGHIGVHLTRTARDAFELIVLRGFAQSLWETLEEAGAEFLAQAANPGGREDPGRRRPAQTH